MAASVRVDVRVESPNHYGSRGLLAAPETEVARGNAGRACDMSTTIAPR